MPPPEKDLEQTNKSTIFTTVDQLMKFAQGKHDSVSEYPTQQMDVQVLNEALLKDQKTINISIDDIVHQIEQSERPTVHLTCEQARYLAAQNRNRQVYRGFRQSASPEFDQASAVKTNSKLWPIGLISAFLIIASVLMFII